MVRTEGINSKGDYYYISDCEYTYTKEQQIQTFIIVEDDVLGKCALLKRRKKTTRYGSIYEYSLPCAHIDQRKQDIIKNTITELITQLFAENPKNLFFQRNNYTHATTSTQTCYYTSSIHNLELKDPQEYLLYPLDKGLQKKLLNHIKIDYPSNMGLKDCIIISPFLSTINNQEEIPVPYKKPLFQRCKKWLINLLS